MFQLTRKIEYALIILHHMYMHDQSMGGIAEASLQKSLKTLNTEGLNGKNSLERLSQADDAANQGEHLGKPPGNQGKRLENQELHSEMQTSHGEQMAREEGETQEKQENDAFFHTVKSIAELYGIPKMHTAKTFQALCRKGILISKQGIKGGYRTNHSLSTLSLYDLIQSIEGPFGIVRCLTPKSTDSAETNHSPSNDVDLEKGCNYLPFCNITTPMERLNLKLTNLYKQTTVQELLMLPNSQEVQKAQKNSQQSPLSSRMKKKSAIKEPISSN